jgi:hypothetical protein
MHVMFVSEAPPEDKKGKIKLPSKRKDSCVRISEDGDLDADMNS